MFIVLPEFFSVDNFPVDWEENALRIKNAKKKCLEFVEIYFYYVIN